MADTIEAAAAVPGFLTLTSPAIHTAVESACWSSWLEPDDDEEDTPLTIDLPE